MAEKVLPDSQCGFRARRGCIDTIFCAKQLVSFMNPCGSVICSLHDGMRAEVTVDGQTTPEFDVCNGLRQGCVIAPTCI